jgi:hypothetical protein
MNKPRRSGRLAVCILAAGIAFYAQSGTAAAFDFDTGNAPIEVVVPQIIPVVYASVLSPGDASLILRWTVTVANAWFDAIAPYHPTAVGVYSRLGRRPASEGATNRNKNIAILYASLRALTSSFPQHAATWQSMLTSVGLDPNDTSTDLTTPVGIGNAAGNAVVAFREHDGMNQLGDAGGRLYNRMPYDDYTNFVPRNTVYDLSDPANWQPNIEAFGNGLFRIQKFVTPQYALTKPYSFPTPTAFSTPPPTDSQLLSGANGFAKYKAQVDQVLATSANLTDTMKMTAELFNDKIRSLGFSTLFITQTRGLTLDQFVQYDFLVIMAAFDGGIPVWQEKTKWNSVRPFTAVHYVYGNQPVTAWGGPGKGTVNNLPGNQWHAYLPVADHPEYPSGSACFCSAHAQASRRFLGSDNMGWSVSIPAGSSLIEPGVTPATDITIGPFATFTEFETVCGLSRNWGGVHFLPSIGASHTMCGPIGDKAYDFLQAHLNGTAP